MKVGLLTLDYSVQETKAGELPQVSIHAVLYALSQKYMKKDKKKYCDHWIWSWKSPRSLPTLQSEQGLFSLYRYGGACV